MTEQQLQPMETEPEAFFYHTPGEGWYIDRAAGIVSGPYPNWTAALEAWAGYPMSDGYSTSRRYQERRLK